jgi:hypothetical protein
MSAATLMAVLNGRVTEKDFAQCVVDLAHLHGWFVYRAWTSIHSPAGWPDLTMVRGERLVAAELKREGKQPTPAQRRWLDALGAVPSIEVFVWRPSDWAEIVEVLR